MTFEQAVMSFAERFLSARSVDLIVAPALADLEFERCTKPVTQVGRFSVLRAVAGALRDEFGRASRGMAVLTLVPACYYIFLLVIGFDVFSIAITVDFLIVAGFVLLLSVAPVVVCFWPERHTPPAVDEIHCA